MMRTTLLIEDQLLAELKRTAEASGKPLKQVVNEALQAGLQCLTRPEPIPYRLMPASLGQARPGIDLCKASDLADRLEDDALRQKIEQRR
ncbi:MAG: DUF2191 domain-containing protein [Pseudomonadota bacterium]|nr:DUF2191 domain-containing protein [Pseudomonadota bacterium]